MPEFTPHGYGEYVFDENGNQYDSIGYQAGCITDYALKFLDGYNEKRPFFMTTSQTELHHQSDHDWYEGPNGLKERFRELEPLLDLKLPGSNTTEEYLDYLGCCRSLDGNLGRLVEKLWEKGLYENMVIMFVSNHGPYFKTRNWDEHLNGYDDCKRSCHPGRPRVPPMIAGPR